MYRGNTIRHTVRTGGTGDWLLIYTLRGSGLYRYEGGEYRSRPHDVTLFRPGAFQDYQCAPGMEKWDLLFAHFLPRPEWPAWLNWPEKSAGFMALQLKDPALCKRVVSRLRDMVHLARGAQPRREELGLNALEEALLWCDSANPRRTDAGFDPRVRKAMEFINAHLAEPFSGEALACAAGLSASHLRHLFHAQTGDSPRNFQEQQRLRRARDLLVMSRLTVSEISQELGFENPFYFTLRFKKHTGENPTAFRKRMLGRDFSP